MDNLNYWTNNKHNRPNNNNISDLLRIKKQLWPGVLVKKVDQ